MAETTRSGIYITAGTRGRHDGGGRKSSAQHKPVFYDAYLDLMRSRGVGGTNEKWDDFLVCRLVLNRVIEHWLTREFCNSQSQLGMLNRKKTT